MSQVDRAGYLYLGRRLDSDEPLFYEASDLTTHAVCLGMTGSGKTGLGIVLLEEAILQGVPVLAIDPKGDIANLLLTFPDLRPEDFRPWVSVHAARRRDLSLDAYAEEVSGAWADGLDRWGIPAERIERLKAAADFAIYTPGSDAGRQVNLVHTFEVPDLSWRTDEESLREKIASTVSALLALVGIQADPLRSREQILLANILEDAWRKGESLDLTGLLARVQKPPFSQLGAFPLETFFPEKERLALALALNALIAAPSFENWLEGEPLDVEALLWTPDRKPRVSIFYLAHLDDAGRMFFVTLLLEAVRAWLRRQSGTTDLRALLYFDELYGYLPPHPHQPPSKPPLMALLKGARALGLGLVLATQNPVDLDYKALSNAGTWMVGKLQTDRDRGRALEGVAEATLEAGGRVDRAALTKLVAGLEARTFLLRNVHADAPLTFRSRWAISYLRGPLTRDQIRALRGSEPGKRVADQPRLAAAEAPAVLAADAPAPKPAPTWAEAYASAPPALPSGVREFFVPVETSLEWALRQAEEAEGTTIVYQGKRLVYEPRLLAQATVRYKHTPSRLAHDMAYTRLARVPPEGGFVDWEIDSQEAALEGLETRPAQVALFALLPSGLTPRALTAWRKEFADVLYRQEVLTIWHNPTLKLYAAPGETEKQFLRRCRKAAQEARDAAVEKLRDRYEAKFDRIETRLRREERELTEDEAEYEARKREELFTAGESLLSFLGGRRSIRPISIQSRKRRLTQQSKLDIEESEEEIKAFEEKLAELEAEYQEKETEENERWARAIEAIEPVEIRPTKTNIRIERFGLAWLPRWEVAYEDERTGEPRTLSLPAFGKEP
ncbi:MAG: DUF87 domain-containing protein [Anaerolineae bacterium]|nr:MAG: DUF87 domain-containing protein [Anaerolineae bacterium]